MSGHRTFDKVADVSVNLRHMFEVRVQFSAHIRISVLKQKQIIVMADTE